MIIATTDSNRSGGTLDGSTVTSSSRDSQVNGCTDVVTNGLAEAPLTTCQVAAEAEIRRVDVLSHKPSEAPDVLQEAIRSTLLTSAPDAALMFPTLTSVQIARIASHGVTRSIIRGEVLIEGGQTDVPFFVLKAGALECEAAAGVMHHVALSAVGTECLLDSRYFRAKYVQEELIADSEMPYSIVRATQLFESLGTIADMETDGITVRVPPALVQPIAADDVVRVIAQVAVASPLNGTIEVGGPEPFYLEELLERILGAHNDPRRVIVDAQARFFGAVVEKRLLAGDEAELGEIRFDDWLRGRILPCPSDSSATGSIRRGPVEAHRFCVSDVLPGSVLPLGDVAVFSAAGGLCATQARCPHRGGPLSEGAIDDVTVTCPLHGAQFNIWTGALLRGPAKEPLKTYRLIIDGDVGRVDVD